MYAGGEQHDAEDQDEGGQRPRHGLPEVRRPAPPGGLGGRPAAGTAGGRPRASRFSVVLGSSADYWPSAFAWMVFSRSSGLAP